MFNSGNFQQIFLDRINHKNLGVVKKMFVFNTPLQERPNSIERSTIRKERTTKLQSKKKLNAKKFPAGFFQKTNNPKSNDQQFFRLSEFSIQATKAPEIQLSSFLLGMHARIQRENNFKISQRSEEDQASKSHYYRVSNYESIVANINKIKDLKTQDTITFSSLRPQNIELPILQKKQISSASARPTDINSSTQAYRNIKNKSVINVGLIQTFNPSSPLTKKRKVCQQINPKVFEKGYMFYDKQNYQFWSKNKEQLENNAGPMNACDITAKCYIVLNINNLEVITSKNKSQSIQIASLTKIMTCYLTILACKKYQVDINTYVVRVSDKVVEVPGTSAQLQPGDLFTIQQLLYGLMLPSGNDSSVILSDIIGKIIQKHKKKPTFKTPSETFISHMNLLAKQLALQQTFQNSSGLSMNPNYSTPIAIATLTSVALRNKQFRQIINTKQFQMEVKNDRFGLVRKIVWTNTNRLLWKGWQGVKTGQTETAGPCLAGLKNNYLVCVFNCESFNKRFTQCLRIVEEIQKNENNTNTQIQEL